MLGKWQHVRFVLYALTGPRQKEGLPGDNGLHRRFAVTQGLPRNTRNTRSQGFTSSRVLTSSVIMGRKWLLRTVDNADFTLMLSLFSQENLPLEIGFFVD